MFPCVSLWQTLILIPAVVVLLPENYEQEIREDDIRPSWRNSLELKAPLSYMKLMSYTSMKRSTFKSLEL